MSIDLDCLPIRIIRGAGSLSQLGDVATECGGRRPLVVTDTGVQNAGHVSRAVASLTSSGLSPVVFDDVQENPTSADVERCAVFARNHDTDILIGLGGGSSMDTAKGCNFLYTNGGEMKDYRGGETAAQAMLPFVAVPTTAGTGSECQRYALISDPDTHQKMACGDPKALAKTAILDPELTLTQPTWVTACTGIDALSHSIETAVTAVRSEKSLACSREAFALLARNLSRVCDDPADLAAREQIQSGAAFAGAAIEFSMLGAAHAAANPLTAHYGIVHGQAVGVMLPAVVRFNGKDSDVAAEYAEIMSRGDILNDLSEPPEQLAAWIESMLARFQLKTRLTELGIGGDVPATLVQEAAGQWTAGFNPIPVKEEDFRVMYESVM